MPPIKSHDPAGKAHAKDLAFGLPARYLPTQGAWYLPPNIPNASGTQTILLTEDDDDLRVVMQVFLEVAGYKVLAAADAANASRLFRSSGAADLLLTDIEMPGRSGIELARELTGLCPSLPVLIISGGFITEEMKREIQAANWRFHCKPCSFQVLIMTIHTLLHSTELST